MTPEEMRRILDYGYLVWIDRCGNCAFTRDQTVDERLEPSPYWLIELPADGTTWMDARPEPNP